MKRGLINFVPQRLTQARLARNSLKKDLAVAIGVSSEALRSYENGAARPLPDRVQMMADFLNFPVSFFSKPCAKSSDVEVFWRNQKRDTKASRDQTEQRVIWVCEVFSDLEEYVEFPEIQLPFLDLPKDWKCIDDEDLEIAAESCRAQWGLGDYPLPDMTLAVENIGIPVVALDIDSAKQSGFSHFDYDLIKRPIIGHNTRRSSSARARFNVAHELAHVLLHQNVSKSEYQKHFDLIERQAHRFAGALLFPRTSFYREVRYASLDAFCALKRDWNMTISAQISRAFDLGVVDSERKKSLFIAAGRKGYNKALGEPFDVDTPMEKPRMLKRAVDVVESISTLQLKVLEQRLSLPSEEVFSIFGRGLEPANSNVVPLRRV